MTTIVDTLAEAQNRLYALANRLPDAADRIEVMAIHSLVGIGVYDAMPKETAAANAMLALLIDLVNDHKIKPQLIAGGYYGMTQAAIAQAEAAGIGEK